MIKGLAANFLPAATTVARESIVLLYPFIALHPVIAVNPKIFALASPKQASTSKFADSLVLCFLTHHWQLHTQLYAFLLATRCQSLPQCLAFKLRLAYKQADPLYFHSTCFQVVAWCGCRYLLMRPEPEPGIQATSNSLDSHPHIASHIVASDLHCTESNAFFCPFVFVWQNQSR